MEETERILGPIHDRQALSEADNAFLPAVTPAWLAIRKHLADLPQDRLQAPVKAIQNCVWEARYKKQVMSIHAVAWALHPAQHAQPITVALRDAVMTVFRQQFQDAKTLSEALSQFYAFRGQQGGFRRDNYCWSIIESPILFWQLQTLDAPVLGPFAERLMETPANSVPSERAFSIQNLVHTKAHNTLNTIRVDKLQYIHINENILCRKSNPTSKTPISYSEDDLVALEDILLGEEYSLEDEEDKGTVTEATGMDSGEGTWLGQVEEVQLPFLD